MPESFLYRKIGRMAFLLTSVLVAALCGVALKLLQAHNDSHRALLAVESGFVLLGVLWLRSLERRLMDANLPRWIFWPYFLFVFAACSGAHVLKVANGPQTLALFILLQLPLTLYRGRTVHAGKSKPARRVAPLAALDFAVYLFLIVGLWHVLHLLRGDVIFMPHSHALKYALDGGAVFLGILWILSVRGRLKALGRLSWTLDYCFLVLIPCLLLLTLEVTSFSHTLILFVILQIPAVFMTRESIPARVFPIDSDS